MTRDRFTATPLVSPGPMPGHRALAAAWTRVKQLPSGSTCSLGHLAALHGPPALHGYLAVPAWTKPSKAPRASPQQVLVLLLCPQTSP